MLGLSNSELAACAIGLETRTVWRRKKEVISELNLLGEHHKYVTYSLSYFVQPDQRARQIHLNNMRVWCHTFRVWETSSEGRV